MNMKRPVLLLAAAALAVTPLAACSSSSSSAPTSEAAITGSPVAAKDDIAALCKSIVEQKLAPDAAAAMAESSGYTSRVIKLDGEGQAVTTDLREDRMNFEVTSNVVTACTVG